MPIQILTTLEYLGKYGSGVPKDHFGVVLQVAWMGDDTPTYPPEFFQPWRWQKVKMKIWDVSSASNPLDLAKSLYQGTPPAAPKVNLDLTGIFTSEYWKNNSATLKFKVPTHGVDQETEENDTTVKSWPTYLAQLSQYPYPLPQALNLAHILPVDVQVPATGEYIAAPYFEVAGSTYTPVDYTLDVPTKRVTIHYREDAMAPVPAPPAGGPGAPNPSPAFQVQVETYAIKPVAIKGVELAAESSDWQAHLIAGTADLFDLPGMLLKEIRDNYVNAPSSLFGADSPKNALASVQIFILQGFRDLVGLGAKVAPDGLSLLTLLWTMWLPFVPDATKTDDVKDFIKRFPEKALAESVLIVDWTSVLKAVPELDGCFIPSPSDLGSAVASWERLHQFLMQQDVLLKVLQVEWDAVKAKYFADIKYGPIYTDFLAFTKAHAGELNLHAILLRGNLGGSWKSIATAVTKTELRKKIGEALDIKYKGAAPRPQPDWYVKLQGSLALTDASGKPTSLGLQIASLVPDANDVSATRISEGLSVVADSLNSMDNHADDPLRQMAGLCVLMRGYPPQTQEAAKPNWCCLTAGNMKFLPKDQSGNGDWKDVVEGSGATVIPLPMHDQSGVRRATITYDNQPLMSKSPAAYFGEGMVQQMPTPRLIEYLHPFYRTKPADEIPKDARWKIPALTFGYNYDIAVGRVSNSGVLPKVLADTADPAKLGTLDNKPFPVASGMGAVTVPYLRRVPVGQLQFRMTTTFNGSPSPVQGPPPSLPGVIPLGRTAFPRPANPKSSRSAEDPLFVLSQYNPTGVPQAMTISIRKPTVDIYTWDRWAGRSVNPQVRKMVWSQYHQAARKSRDTIIALDDPAVMQLSILVEGRDLTNDTVLTREARTVDWTDLKTGTLLEGLQFKSIDLNITTGTAAKPYDLVSRTLTIAAGTVAKVTIKPIVSDGDRKRFAKDISDGKEYVFLIEAAYDGLPTADALRQKLAIQETSEGMKYQLNALSIPPLGKFIGGAEIHTQRWRWDGRPFHAPFPFAEFAKGNWSPPPVNSNLRVWELQTFGARKQTDRDVRAMETSASTDGTFALTESLAGDLTAKYYRVGVEVTNRYGPLVPIANQRTSTLTGNTTADGGWKRYLRKSKITQKPPKPAVKMILPLTRSLDMVDPVSTAADVLVILQGPWFSHGGLAERLQVELTTAEDSLAGTKEKPFQAGPDPIAWQGKRSDLGTTKSMYEQYSSKEETYLSGPVGHTFDSSPFDPLWLNASYVLKAPKSSLASPWTFAQVRFRRVLVAEGLENATTQESEWTDPYWVQFLPSNAYAFTDKPVDLGGCTLDVGSGSISIKADKTLTLSGSATGLKFVLLLTEKVPDLSGRQDQERFYALWLGQRDGAATWTFAGPGESPPSNDYIDKELVGRVLAIQCAPTNTMAFKDEKDFWARTFPSGTASPSARIVYVSAPVFKPKSAVKP